MHENDCYDLAVEDQRLAELQNVPAAFCPSYRIRFLIIRLKAYVPIRQIMPVLKGSSPRT